jgi:hypothetical protein
VLIELSHLNLSIKLTAKTTIALAMVSIKIAVNGDISFT